VTRLHGKTCAKFVGRRDSNECALTSANICCGHAVSFQTQRVNAASNARTSRIFNVLLSLDVIILVSQIVATGLSEERKFFL
jgi:hypothetical protein